MALEQGIVPHITILRKLAQKPREQIHFTPDAFPILKALQAMRMVTCTSISNLPEQNIWTIEQTGLKWLNRHGLVP